VRLPGSDLGSKQVEKALKMAFDIHFGARVCRWGLS